MRIILIRHAESESNIGERTSYPESIKLTQNGERQAESFADQITETPDLIFVTNHLRTEYTAKYVLRKHPNTVVKILPLHEFTFLSPAMFENTTPQERHTYVKEYWNRCDPDFIHGPGAESFNQFVIRIKESLNVVAKLDHSFVLIFTHGHVIRLVRQMIDLVHSNNQLPMQYYRDVMLPIAIPNLEILEIGDDQI
jgi:broad specificity phosphatase PhoE